MFKFNQNNKNMEKLDIKKFLFSVKEAVMSADIDSLKEEQLKEVYNNLKSIGSVEVTDINNIDGETLDNLQCGDKVIKITGKQKHLYVVSYKGEGVGEGICLTYCDASLVETVSYDLTENGWVYNSTDKWTKE